MSVLEFENTQTYAYAGNLAITAIGNRFEYVQEKWWNIDLLSKPLSKAQQN